MPRRENAGRRRTPTSTRRTILIYCGGERTEPAYFNGLRRVERSSGVTIKLRADGLSPDALVRAAAEYRRRRPGTFDEVWAVVDVLDFGRFAGGVVEAVRRAKRLDATSVDWQKNPSTSVWRLVEQIVGQG